MTRRGGFWLATLLLVLCGLPLLAARPTPLQDWPNHLARLHIVLAMQQGDLFWSRFYQFNSWLVPTVALDFGLLGLLRLGLGLGLAGQVFICLTYLAFVGGVCAVAVALRAYDPIKVGLAGLLFTSADLFWGLADYLLGVGVALLLLAGWLAAARPVPRLAIAIAGTALLFFCHLIAAMVFVVLIGCFDVAEGWTARPRRIGGLSALAGLAVLLALRAASPLVGEGLFDMVYAGGPEWSGILRHKFLIFARALGGGGVAVDVATAALALGAVAIFTLAARPRLSVAAALAVAALLLLALLAPERIGTGSVLDTRLAMLPLLLALAAVRIEWRGLRLGRLARLALVAGLGAHAWLLFVAWRAAAAEFTAFGRLAAGFAPGSLVLMAHASPITGLPYYRFWSPPLSSLETQAVTRDAFVPMIFANPTEQPLALRPEFEPLKQPLDFSNAEAVGESQRRLALICPAWPHVFVTVLYPTAWFRAAVPPNAVLGGTAHFVLLDGCALGGAWATQPRVADGA